MGFNVLGVVTVSTTSLQTTGGYCGGPGGTWEARKIAKMGDLLQGDGRASDTLANQSG
jgi:hypothetical protein